MKLTGLKAVRHRLLLTQEEVAAKANMSKSTVNRLELGVQEARISTVRRLAAALDVPPAELTGTLPQTFSAWTESEREA